MSEQVFLLPDLGEGLTEAEIVRWLVAEGDVVAVDQAVVEVETAKSVVEVPTPYAGRVAVLHGTEGATLDVGRPLVTVAALEPRAASTPSTSSRTAPSAEAEAYREEEQAGSGNVLIGYGTAATPHAGRRRRPRSSGRPAPAGTPAASSPVATPTAPDASRRRVPLVVSPLVRRLARDHGMDLATVEGSGRGGVITRQDVERRIASVPHADGLDGPHDVVTAGERRTPLNGFRKAVSAALSRSRSEIPEATVWVDVDATALVALRESLRTPADPGPGLLAYLARFTVAALKEYPVLNARLDTERQEIVEYDRVDLALAVQGDRGLVTPAVLGADGLTTRRLDEEIRRVTDRARQGRSTAAELAAGTFTLNNYGSFRVDGSAAIINHPQVAILGFGRILDRAWVVDGEICVRKITQMSLVFDHRVCDGGTAAGFMRSVADAVENPASVIARL
ncbi:2-oxo acid dehydrogenase subunit E2 [Nocardioides sp. WL0053]|uniref:Dihydrolipoamide acetyltransferase component of pyruvate dehydrogenase complex n=1 Tax=Nocardioides jiangsuensis TaxID=2866161 RepID=A0ABS7RIP6_9ACTN|nr:dihydrolipoamide acetyltransferase family protein [Nocardioides jiangsuensis]MBY9074912.1 2-oxo acid dehydrogenase subunit E2 [Nocardioides jiangsuensis]